MKVHLLVTLALHMLAYIMQRMRPSTAKPMKVHIALHTLTHGLGNTQKHMRDLSRNSSLDILLHNIKERMKDLLKQHIWEHT